MSGYSFFGLQLVMRAVDGEARKRLHQAIAGGGAAGEQSLADKRAFYKTITTILAGELYRYELAYWDYIADPARGESEFDTWCSELEGQVATENEEVGKAVDESFRLSAEREYVAVTVLFLLEAGGNSDTTVAARCDLPEAEWFHRDTLVKLVHTIPMLSFSSVKADAVYIVPGNDQDGLSFDDVHGGGWEYLRQVS
jgi:hypothetical protein